MVNLLPNSDDHSVWAGAVGFTAGQTDRAGGTTAESWVEHSGAGDKRYAEVDGVSIGAGRFIAEIFYKQIPGSDANRQFEMDVLTAGTLTNGVWIYGDKDGNVITSDFNGWTLHSATITPSTNGFYRMSLDFTTTDAGILMYIAQCDIPDLGSYTGDGSSGWIIDDHRLYAYGTVIDDGETTEEPVLETPSTGAGSTTGQSWRQKYDHLPKYTGSWERKEEYSDRLLDEMDRLYRARDEEEAIVAILLSGL